MHFKLPAIPFVVLGIFFLSFIVTHAATCTGPFFGGTGFCYSTGSTGGIQTGAIPYGNGVSGLATSSLLNFTSGQVGIGTTTPQWLLDLASSTAPQLTLDGGAGNPSWAFRNAGGTLYIATTSPSTNATSSPAAVQINSTGTPGLLVGTSTVTTSVIEDVFSTATTALRVDSNSATKGGCVPIKDADGVGYTYLFVNNGTGNFTTTSCL